MQMENILNSDDTSYSINTLGPRQNGRYFPDDIFKSIFLNDNVWISIKISWKFIPKGPIYKIPAMVQIIACRRPGDKLYLNQWWLVYWRIYASLGLNELKVLIWHINHVNRTDQITWKILPTLRRRYLSKFLSLSNIDHLLFVAIRFI